MVLQKGMLGTFLREIKEDIILILLHRYMEHGFKLPRLIYSDMCCDDRAVLVEICNKLRDMGLDSDIVNETPGSVSFPLFSVPSSVSVSCAKAGKTGKGGKVLAVLMGRVWVQANTS